MLNRYYKCENRKFIFQKWNVIVMTGIVIFVPVMVMTLDSFFGETGEMLCKSKLIQSFYLGQVGYTVLSALFFGNEYQKSAWTLFPTRKTPCSKVYTKVLSNSDRFSQFFEKSSNINITVENPKVDNLFYSMGSDK